MRTSENGYQCTKHYSRKYTVRKTNVEDDIGDDDDDDDDDGSGGGVGGCVGGACDDNDNVVYMEGQLSELFNVTTRVLQGDVLAPFLLSSS